MKKIAEFVVKFRKIILLFFLGFAGYCVYGMTQTKVEYSISSYLDETTDTRRALDIMDKEFYTFGSTSFMVKNISYEEAHDLYEKIEDVEGVKPFDFYNTPDYYKDACAKYTVTFEGTEDDPITVNAFNTIKTLLSDHEYYVSVDLTDNYADTLQQSINFVLVFVVIIIIVVLLITSESFMEVPVFLATFGIAALFNMGTNYWLGTISFVSKSVCVILQLALAIDYAIIMANRFQEEKQFTRDSETAMVNALSKAIPEIFGSSLTTISGMLALCTMSLKLGADLGIVLAKSIVWSMVSVFFVMPALLLMFDKPISKTMHKSLVPKVNFLGKFAGHTKWVMPFLYIALAGVCLYASNKVTYVYAENSIDTERPSSAMIAEKEISNVFGYSTQFVIVMPGNDYAEQLDILNTVSEEPLVRKAQGIANTQITKNDISYYLPEKINYKQFADFINIDYAASDKIYSGYAMLCKEDTRDSAEEVLIYEANKLDYKVSLLDLCDVAFSHDELIRASLNDKPDAIDSYNDIKRQITDAEKQLIGPNYSRVVFEIGAAEEAPETFALIKRLNTTIKGKYPDVIFAGNAMADYDLNKTFSKDNLVVTILTLVFVYVVLVITFKNWGIPFPLCLVIQGAIFINFTYFFLTGINCYFFVNLIVSAIQMGATIDYAIVITNRYTELRKTYTDKKQAIIDSINQSFPTILTSGTILISASFLIGVIVGDPLIATLGSCLCRGCLISIASALLVMPALILLWDPLIDKTALSEKQNAFSRGREILKKRKSGRFMITYTPKEDIEND